MLKSHTVTIGDAKIARLYDSSLLGETAQSLFPSFSREDVRPHEVWLCPHHFNAESGHVRLPVQTFVVEALGKVMLIDTGIGYLKDRPLMTEMHRLTTRYLDRLATLGVGLEAVDYVLFTHLHADHVGWNTRRIGEDWTPTFPNARHIVSRHELETQRRDAATTSFVAAQNVFRDSVQPILDAGLLDIVEDGDEILDLLRFRPAPGHTAGHMRIELRSGGETAVFAGDAIHSPMQIPFWNWSTKWCADPEAAQRSRHELLEFCVNERAVLIPAHFETPHMVRIKNAGGTFLPDPARLR